jgi:hypothetical protein
VVDGLDLRDGLQPGSGGMGHHPDRYTSVVDVSCCAALTGGCCSRNGPTSDSSTGSSGYPGGRLEAPGRRYGRRGARTAEEMAWQWTWLNWGYCMSRTTLAVRGEPGWDSFGASTWTGDPGNREPQLCADLGGRPQRPSWQRIPYIAAVLADIQARPFRCTGGNQPAVRRVGDRK